MAVAAGLGHIVAKVLALLDRQVHDRHEIEWRDAKIEKLTFEMAQLRRVKSGRKSEQLDAEQKALFDEAVGADLAALEAQLAELMAAKRKDTEPAPERPKRAALPAHLPRVERHHEPSDTTCACGCQMKRIGEDVSEKLDYNPGSFTVERHVRGKWACAKCRTLTQAPVPAEIIDKGLPTSGLLAHVLVAKHSDYLPLYRQEAIFERAGLAIPPLDAGSLGGHLRCAPAAVGGRHEGRPAAPAGAARRRDAGGRAGTRHGQDPSRLSLGLRQRRL